MKKNFKDFIIQEVFVKASEGCPIVDSYGEEKPWIFDFKKVLISQDFIDIYTDAFFEKYRDTHPFQVVGLETGAVPLVTAIVLKSREFGLEVKGSFMRKSRKKDGKHDLISGVLSSDPIILVDDIMNTGRSFMYQSEVLKTMRERNPKVPIVRNIFSIIRYREKEEYPYFMENKSSIDSLFTLDDFKERLGTSLLTKQSGNVEVNQVDVLWKWIGGEAGFSSQKTTMPMTFVRDGVVFVTD